MIKYVIDIIMLQLIFLAVYQLIANTRYFTINRWYLLSSLILSVLLPYVSSMIISQWLTLDSGFLQPIKRLDEVIIQPGMKGGANKEIGMAINIWLIVKWLIISVSAYKLIRLTFAFNHIRQLINTAKHTQTKSSVHFYTLADSNEAFTFFNHIVLGENIPDNQIDQVNAHEKVHASALHSIDLLLVEFLKAIMWFNPLIYFYKKAILLNHEYEADAKTVDQINKHQYMNSLINRGLSTQSIQFINPFFNQSNLKNRIIMLQSKSKSKVDKFKYLFIIPAMLLSFTYLSCTNERKDTLSNKDAIPFSKIDKVPHFKDCKGNNKELKECTADIIKKHIKNEIVNYDYKKEIRRIIKEDKKEKQNKTDDNRKVSFESSIKKNNKIQRIYVQFKINKEGKITEVKARARSKKLKQIGEDIVKTLPDMIPGKQNGKNIDVLYQLPIVLKAELEEE